MDQDQSQNNGADSQYTSDGWVQISSYPSSMHQSPVHEYQGFNYMGGPQSLPIPTYTSRMPPPTTTHSHQQLLPLIMPSHPTWPSMLTNPAGYQTQPVALPHSAPASKPPKLPAIHAPTPRKTLTDQDRRRMCQYHEEHPTVKQTQIGAMFGVERSTVSKVLRLKEKYLFPDDRSTSPVKKSKGKSADIDRALSSWARKSLEQGIPLTDAIIKEKARMFAATVGNGEVSSKATSATWLEKFKQKHNIGKGGKLARRASESNMSDSATFSHGSAGNSATQTPNEHSPDSNDESPMTKSRTNDGGVDDYMDYRHSNSESSTSLSSTYTDNTSPGAPFNFSPETTQGPFMPSQYVRLPNVAEMHQPIRARSQTFPTLNIDPTFTQNPENVTPKFSSQSSDLVSTLESPNQELPSAYSIDSAISSPMLRHRSSNGSMPTLSAGSTSSSMLLPGSSPSSPTQDEARRGLETFISFMNSSTSRICDEKDFMTVLKLTEKLKKQSLTKT